MEPGIMKRLPFKIYDNIVPTKEAFTDQGKGKGRAMLPFDLSLHCTCCYCTRSAADVASSRLLSRRMPPG